MNRELNNAMKGVQFVLQSQLKHAETDLNALSYVGEWISDDDAYELLERLFNQHNEICKMLIEAKDNLFQTFIHPRLEQLAGVDTSEATKRILKDVFPEKFLEVTNEI